MARRASTLRIRNPSTHGPPSAAAAPAAAFPDSPLSLCGFYAPPGYLASFQALVRDAHASFDNVNFYLTRDLRSLPYDAAQSNTPHRLTITGYAPPIWGE